MNNNFIALIGFSFFILSSCAAQVVTVNIPSKPIANTGLAHVSVQDVRTNKESVSQRTALGEPMGYVNFNPTEVAIVKNLLVDQLDSILQKNGVTTPQYYTCDIVEFGVSTKSTLLYWDVVGHIRLTLKHGHSNINLYGTDSERTYVWPGVSIISKAINRALAKVSTSIQNNANNLR